MPALGPYAWLPGWTRSIIAVTLSGWGLMALHDDACLVATELVTNAVDAASGPAAHLTKLTDEGRVPAIVTTLKSDGTRLLIEVWDEAAGEPLPRNPGLHDENGRGLLIVGEYCDRSGSYRTERGKTVWALLGSERAKA